MEPSIFALAIGIAIVTAVVVAVVAAIAFFFVVMMGDEAGD